MAEYSNVVGTPLGRPSAGDINRDRFIPIGMGPPSAAPLYGGVVVDGGPRPAQPRFFEMPPAQPSGGGGGPVKLEKGSAVYRSTPSGARQFAFALTPDQLSPNWLDEIPLRLAILMRSWIYQFMTDVAGHMGAKDYTELMADPYQDIKAALRAARPVPGDAQLPNTVFQASGFGGPGAPAPAEGAPDPKTQTLQELEAQALRGTPSEALLVYDYLLRRESARTKATVEWLTAPMNLSKVFLTADMLSAINVALEEVSANTGKADDGTLLAEVLASEGYTSFFQLVGTQIAIRRHHRRGGNKLASDREDLKSDYRTFANRLDIDSLRPRRGALVPVDPELERLRSSVRPVVQYDARGRETVYVN